VLRSFSIKNRKTAELKDHLYCLIEKHVELGLSEKDAFTKAIKAIGSEESLKAVWPRPHLVRQTISL
jgi:hypothetical protein